MPISKERAWQTVKDLSYERVTGKIGRAHV